MGNVLSRVLGLIREMTKSYFFGAGGAVSAFDVASQVPTMFYDQLVGGMLNSALVPVFSDYAASERWEELESLLGTLIALLTLGLGGVVLLVIAAAPTIARLLGKGLDAHYLALATAMIRITAPAILFLNIAGLLSAALYAQRRFRRPAFAPSLYNATIVLVVLLLGRSVLQAKSLAVGLLAASVAQVLLQAQGMRHVRWRWPTLAHPALLTIGQLYLPVGLGLLVDQLAVGLSFNIASRTGASGIAWMKYAATLIQFPLGLVVTAVSVAILPTLSRYAAEEDDDAFRTTLAQGLRQVLVLVLPAAVALLVLAEPLVALILQRGRFRPADTLATAAVLRLSVPGLVFAALDQPLIFAFYARKDTWTPALVGVGTVLIYLVLAMLPVWLGEPRLWALILANSIKLALHALWMLYLFTRKIGGMRTYGVGRTTLLASAAALAMGLAMAGTEAVVGGAPPLSATQAAHRLLITGSVGTLVYLLALRLMGVEELQLLRRALQRREMAKGANG